MGASQSVLGTHFAHREGKKHRFKHVGRNEEQGQCGMCLKTAELGAVVYRCVRCRFVLHADCYSRPEIIGDHFAHPAGHPLKLSREHKIAAGRQCNICAVALDDGGGAGASSSAFVYGCSQCHGFYAHPRCAILPQTTMLDTLHGHTLTLLSPPRWSRSRKCLNTAQKCPNAKRLNSDAWSYQCNLCNVELCLACQLPGGDGGGGTRARQGTAAGRWRDNIIVNGHLLGTAIGTSLRAMGCACIGAPTPPPPTKG